jgi:hypothetical protein
MGNIHAEFGSPSKEGGLWNKAQAARALGICVRTLDYKTANCQIARQDWKNHQIHSRRHRGVYQFASHRGLNENSPCRAPAENLSREPIDLLKSSPREPRNRNYIDARNNLTKFEALQKTTAGKK